MSGSIHFGKESPELDRYMEESFNTIKKEAPTLEWRDFRIGFIAGALANHNSCAQTFQYAFKELIEEVAR